MDRTLLALAAGLILGLGLGFVLFSSEGERAQAAGPQPTVAASAAGAEPGEAAPSLREPTPNGDAGLPEPAATRAPLVETQVREALAQSGFEAVTPLSGTAQLSGRVEDPDGMGVEGVVILAFAQEARDRLRRSENVGQGAPDLSLESALRRAAESHSAGRARRFQATTDAEGAFHLRDLPESDFRLEAYKLGYTIRQSNTAWLVPAGSEVSFVATPLVEVTVGVTLPDGARPEEAMVLCSRFRDGRDYVESWAWSPEEPVLRLAAGEVKLTAAIGIPSISSTDVDSADMRSETRSLTLVRGASCSLNLLLEGRSGIRGRVRFAKDVVSTSNVLARLLALGADRKVDRTLLGQAEPTQWVQSLGDFAFLDLEPGPYAVGIARGWSTHVEVHRVVEVGQGISICDLALPAIDPAEYIVARVSDPEGEALRDATFQFLHGQPGAGTSGWGLRGIPAEDGRLFIGVPPAVRAAYFGEPGAREQFQLQVKHEEYGMRQLDLEPGQTEVELRYGDAAQLNLVVEGYTGGDYVGRVAIELREQLEADELAAYRKQRALEPSGVLRVDALVPGQYEVKLVLREPGSRSHSSRVIARKLIELRAGDNVVQVALPTLFPLDVLVPGAGEETYVYLSVLEAHGGTRGLDRVHCDAQGRARIDGLPAGEYVLSVNGGLVRGSMSLTMPTREVVFSAE